MKLKKRMKQLAALFLAVCLAIPSSVGEAAYAKSKDSSSISEENSSDKKQGNNGNHYGNDKGNNGNGNKKVNDEGNNGNGSKKVNDEGNNGNHYGQKKHAGSQEADSYAVSFDVTNEWKNKGVNLPADMEVEAGTTIDELTIASLDGYIFGGWCYDAEGTQLAASTDVITDSITLYADMIEIETPELEENVTFDTVSLGIDESADFSFKIEGYEDGCIKSIIDTSDNSEVPYTVNGDVIIPELEKGHSYIVTLAENTDAAFVLDGEVKEDIVDTLYIITDKETVNNLRLGDIVYINVNDVSNLSGKVFDGLFNVSLSQDGDSAVSENKYKGSFKYKKTNLEIGDTVAIYDGIRPDMRSLDTIGTEDDKDIAYVTIIGKAGSTYYYEKASVKDVIFIPDVLPVALSEDLDGDINNCSAIISKDVLTYSGADYAEMNLDENTTVDAGDYIAFYVGTMDNGAVSFYAEIIGVSENDGSYLIDYEIVTEEEMMASMDLYSTRSLELTLDEESIDEVTAAIEQEALDSGFVDEVAEYLTALAFETDGFKELSDDLDLDLKSYDITFEDGTSVDDETFLKLCADNKTVSIKDKSTRSKLIPGSLMHFEGDVGLRLELVASMTILIGKEADKNHMEIRFEASFEQEVMVSLNTSSSTIWKKKWFIPYVSDYRVSVNFDVGTFACAGLTARAKTVKEKVPDFDWANVSGKDGEQAIIDIGKQLTDLMEKKQVFMGEKLLDENGEEIERYSNGGALADKYANFIEASDESWIKLVDKNIITIAGAVDAAHIIAFEFTVNFIIAADVYVSLGATAEMGVAKRYMFTIYLLSNKSYSNTVELETPHINVDVYIFGTAGIRIGLKFSFAVGLFSVKLDSIGVTVEVGFYLQFWGYFYLHLYKEGSQPLVFEASGAILLELGIYVDIRFVAQLFSNDDFTYDTSIETLLYPLYQYGENQNVFDFFLPEDDNNLSYEVMAGTKSITLPKVIFTMQYLELRDGEEGVADYDDSTESRFDIKLSNDYFKYDAKNNQILINVPLNQDITDETCEMTIIWKGCQGAFTSFPIERTITIKWTDPEKEKYIWFVPYGGSSVSPIVAKARKAITAPADPVRSGYHFAGWYTSADFKDDEKYVIPAKMPAFDGSGITLYAKWEPGTAEYTIYYYKEQKRDNGYSYMVEDIETRIGSVGFVPTEKEVAKDYPGYEITSMREAVVKADGSTVISVSYGRKQFTVDFTYGELKDGTSATGTIEKYAKYGDEIKAPVLSRPGYKFLGFEGLTTDENGYFTVTEDATYEALWRDASEVDYTIIHYGKLAGTNEYEVIGRESGCGYTGDTIHYTECSLPKDLYIYETSEVAGKWSPWLVIKEGSNCFEIYYERTKFDLNYYVGDELVANDVNVAWGTKLEPIEISYVIEGYYTDPSLLEEYRFDVETETMPASNLNLYIKGEEIKPPVLAKYRTETYFEDADNPGVYERGNTSFGTGYVGETVEINHPEYLNDIYHYFDEDNENNILSGVITEDGELVLKAYYKHHYVNVYFDANGGILGEDGECKSFATGVRFAASDPVRPGYDFLGWYDEEGTLYYEGKRVEKELHLTAMWEQKTVEYTVEHYVMDVNGEYPETPEYSESFTAMPGTERYIYTLIKEDIEDGNFFYTNGTIDGEIAYEAEISEGLVIKLYYERAKYNVTWEFNGGEPADDNYTKGLCYYGAPIVAPEVVYPGYTAFSVDIPETVPDHSVIFSYYWYTNNYTIRYDGNGGTVLITEEQLFYDVKHTLCGSSMAFRDGYTLAGWSYTAGGEKAFDPYQEVINLTQENNAVITLYAVWEQDR